MKLEFARKIFIIKKNTNLDSNVFKNNLNNLVRINLGGQIFPSLFFSVSPKVHCDELYLHSETQY